MSLTSRLYVKNTADATARSYLSDGEGKIVDFYTKVYTISAAVGAGVALVLPLVNPKGSKISSFTAQIRTQAGVITTLDADIHEFVLDPATSVLTITARGGGIAQNSILTIYYTVG